MSMPGDGGQGQWTPPLGGTAGPAGDGGYYPPQPPEKKSNLVWILLGCGVAAVFGVFVLGIVAAIAIPNFLKFQGKAKQSEARVNLQAAYVAQTSYFGNNGSYAGGEGCFDKIGWQPPGPALFNYYCGGEVLPCAQADCDPCANEQDLSVSGEQVFVIMATGNIDRDPFCDVWTVDESGNVVNIMDDGVN